MALVGNTARGVSCWLGAEINSQFYCRFCCRLTSDKYRLHLILFDCQKGQIIGSCLLQLKPEQELTLCAFILGFTWKSFEFPGTRILCKSKMPPCYCPHYTQISPCVWWVPNSWEEFRGIRDIRSKGKCYLRVSTPTSSLSLPLLWILRSSDHQSMGPTPTFASLVHLSTIPICFPSSMANQELGTSREPLRTRKNHGCAVGFLHRVWFVSSPFAEMQIISISIFGMTL